MPPADGSPEAILNWGMIMQGKRMEVTSGGERVYDIVIRKSYDDLPGELERLSISGKKLCIVTETGVAGFYLEEVKALFAGRCKDLCAFIFPQGEASKNLDTVADLYRFLLSHHFDRKDMLIALGGGVTGDLTGFAAATYLRGIDFIQLPTSLLAQVDSSIGGKTGVDFLSYKNMVGAFYMPRLVYINISTLATLSLRQYHSGLGEVIKHGLIQDAAYYRWLKMNKEKIAARDKEIMAVMVEGSCLIKRAVVQQDPGEKGIRAYLNFGHTLGHAIEKLSDFRLTHGECVGIGSVLAASISEKRGYITPEEYRDIKDMFAYFGFPVLPADLNSGDILEATRHDKKMEEGKLKFVLLETPGQAVIRKDVTDQEILESLKRGDMA